MTYLPQRWWTPRAWKVWLSWLHWRMETYGVYYPAGKFNGTAFRLMLRQLPAYRHWLTEIERLRDKPYTAR